MSLCAKICLAPLLLGTIVAKRWRRSVYHCWGLAPMLKTMRVLTIAITLSAIGQAFAQTEPPPLAPPGQTVLVTPEAELQFAPRFWYFFQSTSQSKPADPRILSVAESNEFPMGGGALSARFQSLPET